MDYLSDFDQLIEMLNFNYAISLLMEYFAFIKLRLSRPNIERPYKIPLNTVGCVLLFSPSIIFTVLVLALANATTYVFATGVILVGLVIFWGKRDNSAHYHQYQTSREEEEELTIPSSSNDNSNITVS